MLKNCSNVCISLPFLSLSFLSSLLLIVPFVSRVPAVILACQGKTFDLSPSFKINIAETVSGWERKCSGIGSKTISSVAVRRQLCTVRLTVLRLGKYSSFLIGNMTKHLKATPPSAASPESSSKPHGLAPLCCRSN